MILINVYAPPESDKHFFNNLLDVIAQETEGILICGGDFNIILNQNLDTSRKKSSRIQLSRHVKTALTEMGVIDIWRELHPVEKDYTFYSAPHTVYTRIDYFLINTVDRYRIEECKIGVADLSDHSALYLSLNLSSRKRITTWRLNVGVLNNPATVEQIKNEINSYREENDNGEVDSVILWDAMKAVMRGKLIARTSLLKKARLEIYQNKIGELKTLEQQHKGTCDPGVLHQIKEAKKRVNEILGDEVEKKIRYMRQTYYEAGPKATKLLARRIKKKQVQNVIHKIRDPTNNSI